MKLELTGPQQRIMELGGDVPLYPADLQAAEIMVSQMNHKDIMKLYASISGLPKRKPLWKMPSDVLEACLKKALADLGEHAESSECVKSLRKALREQKRRRRK